MQLLLLLLVDLLPTSEHRSTLNTGRSTLLTDREVLLLLVGGGLSAMHLLSSKLQLVSAG